MTLVTLPRVITSDIIIGSTPERIQWCLIRLDRGLLILPPHCGLTWVGFSLGWTGWWLPGWWEPRHRRTPRSGSSIPSDDRPVSFFPLPFFPHISLLNNEICEVRWLDQIVRFSSDCNWNIWFLGTTWVGVSWVGSQIAQSTGELRATTFLRQRISIAIQRGNAASVLGTQRHFLSK